MVVDCRALYPFQEDTVEFCLQRKDTLVSLSMGLGKTPCAIEVMNRIEGIPKTLIVCPASVQLNWEREIERWARKPFFCAVITSGKVIKLPENVWIISYNNLKAWRTALREQNWDLAIFDESQACKNTKSQRTKEVFGGFEVINGQKCPVTSINAHKRLFLTGTPILNKPLELWSLVRSVDKQGLGRDWMRFVTRYCAAKRQRVAKNKTVWDCSGASNLQELGDNLRHFMIRMTKEQVLTQLPPKTRQVITIPSTGMIKELSEERNAFEGYKRKSGAEELTRLVQSRLAVAHKKLPLVIEYIQDVLDQDQKVVVFFHHHEIGDELYKEFPTAATLDGRMKIEDRQKNVERFQNDNTCRIFLGSIQAAGVGITLTAASVAIFAELSWVPADLLQAEDRLHRISQQYPVLIQYILAEGSVDDDLVAAVRSKKAIIDKILVR